MYIDAVRKDGNGTITEYRLSDGSVISPNEAVDYVSSGKLNDYIVSTAKNGKKSIRSKPDDTKDNNLDNLPIF